MSLTVNIFSLYLSAGESAGESARILESVLSICSEKTIISVSPLSQSQLMVARMRLRPGIFSRAALSDRYARLIVLAELAT